MIGHYLMTLTPEQEGRVLENVMTPGALISQKGNRCLYGVAHDAQLLSPTRGRVRDHNLGCMGWPQFSMPGAPIYGVGDAFDNLCLRFGIRRTQWSFDELLPARPQIRPRVRSRGL